MSTSLFVTGASSGIGAAFLAQVPADVNEPKTFSRRRADGDWTEVDLGHPRQWPTVWAVVDEALDDEAPDHAIFFHCSGTGDPIGRAVDIDPYEYATVVTLNAASGPSLGQAFLRSCHQRGIRATLVITSSPAAHKDVTGMAQYCSSKDGMEHWARIVAMEQHADSGNRVMTVVPYAVLTEVTRSVMTRDPEEVPLVNYFRQVEAAGEFSSPETCAQQIWRVIADGANGDIVPVGSVVIAERAAAAAS